MLASRYSRSRIALFNSLKPTEPSFRVDTATSQVYIRPANVNPRRLAYPVRYFRVCLLISCSRPPGIYLSNRVTNSRSFRVVERTLAGSSSSDAKATSPRRDLVGSPTSDALNSRG